MCPYIHLFGLNIPSYGLCMAVAMLLACTIAALRVKKRGLSFNDLLIIAACAIGLGIVGAKVLYIVVTYDFSYIIESILTANFDFITYSGLVFYGGLIGGVLGAMLGAKIAKSKLADYSDAVVPVLPLAHAIGRIGCFLSGCCYGMEYSGWPAMCFPNSVAGLSPDVSVLPTQLFEAALNILVFAALMLYTRKKRKGFTALYVYLTIYGVERFVLEFFRGDEIRGIFGAFSTSQWISIILIVIAVGCMILERYKKPSAEECDAELCASFSQDVNDDETVSKDQDRTSSSEANKE